MTAFPKLRVCALLVVFSASLVLLVSLWSERLAFSSPVINVALAVFGLFVAVVALLGLWPRGAGRDRPEEADGASAVQRLAVSGRRTKQSLGFSLIGYLICLLSLIAILMDRDFFALFWFYVVVSTILALGVAALALAVLAFLNHEPLRLAACLCALFCLPLIYIAVYFWMVLFFPNMA